MAEQDIVERLRAKKVHMSYGRDMVEQQWPASDLEIEAAEDIEQYRGALVEAAKAMDRQFEAYQVVAAENASLRQQLAEARPIWLANCRNCGRVVDTRETHEGGDTFGAALSGGEWACSSECWHEIVDGALPHPDREGERE